MMPPLAPDFSNRLLIGAPCPINELGAGNEQSKHGNRVNVVFTTPLSDVSVSVADFDGRHLLNKARPTHTQASPTRSASHSTERANLIEVSLAAQAGDAAGIVSFVNVVGRA